MEQALHETSYLTNWATEIMAIVKHRYLSTYITLICTYTNTVARFIVEFAESSLFARDQGMTASSSAGRRVTLWNFHVSRDLPRQRIHVFQMCVCVCACARFPPEP